MIVVTGAAGRPRSLIVERLLERVPADSIGWSVSDPDKAAAWAERGVPEHRADLLLTIFAADRRGEFAATDTTFGQLLGRPPILMSDVLSRHIAG